MSNRDKDVHVVPHGQDWAIKRPHADRASAVFDRQSDAISVGREMAINDRSELYVHDRHGQIRERNTYGHDPRKTKG